MMRYYLDTEFIERGHEHPIALISIGIVAEDGREFYEVAADGWQDVHASDWVKSNVLPHLGTRHRMGRAEMALEIRHFCGESPEFWAYYADYDWVVLCQLFGTMMDLPDAWPKFCRDVKQLAVSVGNPELPRQESGEHNALADARHIKLMHEWLIETHMGGAA
jgi:hypothetical protein